jgi:segregation and condensation protein B
MEADEKRRIVEALILGAPEPISAARIAEVLPGVRAAEVRELVAELNADYEAQGRAFEVWEVANGWQLRTREAYAPWLRELHRDRALRLSRAALETLAVIAYRQPVTRAEIEHVRGVDVGATVRSLVDRRLVRIAGHRDVPGHPMLYATTRRFLEVFGLESLSDLPTLRELAELTLPETALASAAAASGADLADAVEPAEAGLPEPGILRH